MKKIDWQLLWIPGLVIFFGFSFWLGSFCQREWSRNIIPKVSEQRIGLGWTIQSNQIVYQYCVVWKTNK